MKTAILIAFALTFAACGKGKRSVQYNVSCGNCSLAYWDENEVQHYVKLAPDTTFIPYDVDTIIDGIDTTVTLYDLDIVPGPFNWTHLMKVDQETELYFAVSRLEIQGITTIATRVIDGMTESKTTGPERTFLEFH